MPASASAILHSTAAHPAAAHGAAASTKSDARFDDLLDSDAPTRQPAAAKPPVTTPSSADRPPPAATKPATSQPSKPPAAAPRDRAGAADSARPKAGGTAKTAEARPTSDSGTRQRLVADLRQQDNLLADALAAQNALLQAQQPAPPAATDGSDPTPVVAAADAAAPVAGTVLEDALDASPQPAATDKSGSDALPAPVAGHAPSAETAPLTAGLATTASGAVVERSARSQPAAASAGVPDPGPTQQVSQAITSVLGQGGERNFTLQLKPERLGAVEVKVEIGRDGKASASFIVQHPETLHLLRQDAPQLVSALNQSGVSVESGALEFSLAQQNGDPADARGESSRNGGRPGFAGEPVTADAAPAPRYLSNRLYDLHA